MDINEWLEIGMENRWVTLPYCATHDGDPFMTKEEEEEWESGGDPCCLVLKFIYEGEN